jgi:hypothetical protein
MNNSFILHHISNLNILNTEALARLNSHLRIHDALDDGFFPRYISPVPPKRVRLEEEKDCIIIILFIFLFNLIFIIFPLIKGIMN